MTLELRHLNAFVTVAEELHFGRAAKRLNAAQPAISRDIRAMEDMLGLRFFNRSTRSVELTESGKRFYLRLAEPLAQLGQALQVTRHEAAGKAGVLRLSYMDFATNGPMFRIIRRFRSLFPDVHIDLTDLHTDLQLERLGDQRSDAGFLVGPVTQSGIRTLSISRERLMAVLPSDHRLAERDTVSLAALASEPFVLGEPSTWRSFRRLVDDACAEAGFRPTVMQEASSTDAIFGLVRVGMGVTLYVEGRSAVTDAGLVFRPLAEPVHHVETILAWNPSNKSAILPRFLALTRELQDVIGRA